MACPDEKRSSDEEERQLDSEKPTTSEDVVANKEDTQVIDHAGKADVLSKETSTPASDGHDTDETEDDEPGNDMAGPPIQPQSSRASSIFSRSRTVVPRAQRRGLFGRFTVIPEIDRPQEYTTKTKWIITAIIALAAAAAPVGAGIFYRMSRIVPDTGRRKLTDL